jgi:hypothetical protein
MTTISHRASAAIHGLASSFNRTHRLSQNYDFHRNFNMAETRTIHRGNLSRLWQSAFFLSADFSCFSFL